MTKNKTTKRESVFDMLSAALFAAALAMVFTVYGDFGHPWDEGFHEHYGNLIADYFLSMGSDARVREFQNLAYYGGLFDGTVGLLTRALAMGPLFMDALDARHLITALTGLVCVSGVWAFARRLGGAEAGFWAALLLLVTPSFTGHMFFNPKDIPFATAMIWALYFAARASEHLPKVPDRLALALGLAIGAAMGIRIGGVIVFVYLSLLLAMHFMWQRGHTDRLNFKENANALVHTIVIMIVPALVLTFALWPAIWDNPVHGALNAFEATRKFGLGVDILFDGEMINSLALPGNYLPLYFAVKLPEILLALIAIALPLSLLDLRRATQSGERFRAFAFAALLIAIFFPILYAIIGNSFHYDAIRHFLFILPPLCVLAGVELAHVRARLKQRSFLLSTAVGAAIMVGAALPAGEMVRLHPYEYVYYNALSGGAKGAQQRFELDYWAASYRDAALRLAALTAGAEKTYSVYVCAPIDSAARYLPARFRITERIEDADFLIAFTRWNCDARVDAPQVLSVVASGAKLSVVKDLRQGFTAKGEMLKTLWINSDTPRPNPSKP